MSDEPDPLDVVKRLGEDLREAAEIAGDALSRALMGIGAAVSDFAANAGPVSSAPAEAPGPGDTATVKVRLKSESPDATRPFVLGAVDLVSPDGGRIPASALEVPSTAQVVPARGTATVVVTVSIPTDADPGVYSGRLDCAGVPLRDAQVVVQVG